MSQLFYCFFAMIYPLLTLDVPDDALSRQKYIQRGYPDPLLPANQMNPQVRPHVAQALTRAMALVSAQRQRSAEEMRTMLLKIKPSATEHQPQQRTKQLLKKRQAEEERGKREQEARRQAELKRISTPSITRLNPWSPLDHGRLLWWALVTPQQLQAHRAQFGKEAEKTTGSWLASTLIMTPFLYPFLAFALGTLPPPNDYSPTPMDTLGMFALLLVVWLLSGIFGGRSKDYDGAAEVAGQVVYVMGFFGVIVAVGVVSYLLYVYGIDAQQMGIIGRIVFVALVFGIPLLVAFMVAKAIKRKIERGEPSLLGTGVFGTLVAFHLFLIWVCFFGGW